MKILYRKKDTSDTWKFMSGENKAPTTYTSKAFNDNKS